MSKWILCLMLILLTACNSSPRLMPTAQNGTLDLTAWDFERQGLVSLAGQWEFYWQSLLLPSDFQTSSPKMILVDVPKVWAGYQWEGQPIPANGYATFRLRLKIKPTDSLYGLRVTGIGTAYRLWVNGHEVLHDGVVGITRQTTSPRNDRELVLFSLAQAETVELVVQVANFHNWTGGMWYPVYFGLGSDIIREREYNLAIDLFLYGSLLVIGLYHFGLYSLRRKDRHTFYFGLFCLMIALRTLVTGENYLSILQPTLSWTFLLKTEYLTFYLGLPILMAFLKSLYPDDFGLGIKALQFVSVAFSLIVFFTPAYVFTYTLSYFQLITVVAIFYAGYGLSRAIIHQREGALIISGGQLVVFGAVINDILYANNLVQTGNVISWGLIIFILCQSLALSMRFTRTFTKIETLSQQLGQEITERQQAQESIITSEARYRQLVELSPDGIFIHQAGRIVYVNQAMLTLIRAQQPSDLIGQMIFRFVHPDYHEAVRQRMRRSAEEGQVNPLVEEQFVALDGTVIDVEVAATSYLHQGEKATQVIVRDIRERKKNEAELEKYRNSLEERVNARTTELSLALSETEALLSAAAAILGANQFKAICQNLVTHFTHLVATHWIALFMVDHVRREVVHREYYGDNVPPQWAASAAHMTYEELEMGISGRVFQTKQPVLSLRADDGIETGVTAQKRAAEGDSSLIVVPLVSKDMVIGTITAVNRLGAHVFTPHDVELLMALATQAAVAIDNVRLFEEMQQAKEATEATNKTLKKLYDRLQGELIFARKIQQSLLPPPSPNWAEVEVICYNMPAREIGGDLYAYCRGVTESSPYYGLAVGDVTGKGMPAALLMAVSLASFQAVMGEGLPPHELLQSLDETLVPYTKAQQQNCAMCYVEIRSKEYGDRSKEDTPYSLRIANAASIPPYIKRVTGEVEAYELGGFALGQGLGQSLGYQELELILMPGDLVVLVSDGVIEAHNSRHEMLGFDGMLALMQTAPVTCAADMLDYLNYKIMQFTGGLEQHDDITIVVARV